MKKPRSYLFTSRKQSVRAMAASILGAVSLVSSVLMIRLAYENGGTADYHYGAVVFVCLIFALVGLILAILSRKEPDVWYFFTYLGVILNSADLLLCFVIMYLGVV